jgi:hypothetical protein
MAGESDDLYADLRRRPHPADALQRQPPVLLQQFFNSEIDLDRELAARFGAIPLMSQSSFQTTRGRVHHGTAVLASQDGAAGLRIEVDGASRALSFTYTLGSMIGVGFAPPRIGDADRAAFLDTVRAGEELVFLWGPPRWEKDYLIFSPHKYALFVYAFSPRQTEAAARLTNDVSTRLLDWLDTTWR